MKKLIVVASVILDCAVNAATLTLTTSDASGFSSFDKWIESASVTNAPSADNDYVIDNGRYIRIIWNRTFGGNSLSFGVVGESAGQLIIQRGAGLTDVPAELLHHKDQERKQRKSIEPHDVENEGHGIRAQRIDHAEKDGHFRLFAEFKVEKCRHKSTGK